MRKGYTCVFDFDIRKFEGNPLQADTPFGRPVVVSIGDLSEENDTLSARIEELESILDGNSRFLEITDLRARIAALEEALMPFSKQAVSTDEDFHRTRIINIEERDKNILHARALLKKEANG